MIGVALKARIASASGCVKSWHPLFVSEAETHPS